MTHGWTPALRDRIGVCHAAGRYSVGPEDQLTAGAHRILELGSRVLKLWFRVPLSHSFPLTTGWPEVRSLVDLARTAQMRRVFELPFSTYFLSCDAVGVRDGWQRPLTSVELEIERAELAELTSYLLTEYAGRDVTFVVQNWEGDWAVREQHVPSAVPVVGALDGMVVRLNARQEAIEEAREGHGGRARVLHAAEVNLAFGGEHPELSVTRCVLPQTRLDLYSYSAYETTAAGGDRFLEALSTIRDATRPSAAFGRDNVLVGELGAQEVCLGPSAAGEIIRRSLKEALAFGCPYVLYWQVFDNETLPEAIHGVDYPGFWLVRPDGTRSAQGDVLAQFLSAG